MGAADHATLNKEQLIPCSRATLFDTIASLWGFEWGVISVSDVYKLLTMIHNILDNPVSKWFGDTTFILAYLFNSIDRQHLEEWSS